MSKISSAFESKKALIGFAAAGDPDIRTSEKIILEMARGGCDLIEIGIPFSDPIAQDAVLQDASLRSLQQGATTDRVFKLTKKVSDNTDTPLVYVTYLNVLFRYGYDRFLQNAVNAGVSGVIVLDLPFEEKAELESAAEKYDIDIISVIAPANEERLKNIANDAKGFLYAVCSSDMNTAFDRAEKDMRSIVSAVKAVSDIPVAVSIGVESPNQAEQFSQIADAVTVSTQIARIIEEYRERAPEKVCEFVKSIKNAIR